MCIFMCSGVSVNVHDQALSCAGALFGESTSACKKYLVYFLPICFKHCSKYAALFLTGVMNTCSAFTGGL